MTLTSVPDSYLLPLAFLEFAEQEFSDDDLRTLYLACADLVIDGGFSRMRSNILTTTILFRRARLERTEGSRKKLWYLFKRKYVIRHFQGKKNQKGERQFRVTLNMQMIVSIRAHDSYLRLFDIRREEYWANRRDRSEYDERRKKWMNERNQVLDSVNDSFAPVILNILDIYDHAEEDVDVSARHDPASIFQHILDVVHALRPLPEQLTFNGHPDQGKLGQQGRRIYSAIVKMNPKSWGDLEFWENFISEQIRSAKMDGFVDLLGTIESEARIKFQQRLEQNQPEGS